MLTLYFHATPNSMKAALLIQELELPVEIKPIDIFKGEQHSEAFRLINPNAKVPAIVDSDVTVFDSHAILLYLAEKHGRFLPTGAKERAAALSWLEFIASGLSPFSGQAVHFLHFAPGDLEYAKNRYLKEVERHYRVLDERFATNGFLAGSEYSIADMALWGWASIAGFIFGEKGLQDYPNVQRFMDTIAQRPAAARALAMKENLTFKSEVDEETLKALFPQNKAA